MAAVRYLEFGKIAVLVRLSDLYLHVIRHLRSEFRINRLIWRRDIAKQHFQYGAHPPSCICYDVIILHQKTAFYVPKFVLNFHDIRLRIL